MTPARIAELRALADAATEGPWVHTMDPSGFATFGPAGRSLFEPTIDAVNNAAFCAAARTAIPELLDEVERLDHLARGQEALRRSVQFDLNTARAENENLIGDLRAQEAMVNSGEKLRQRLARFLETVEAERDSALARAEKAERERDALVRGLRRVFFELGKVDDHGDIDECVPFRRLWNAVLAPKLEPDLPAILAALGETP
jgi:hypothetical protein